MDSNASTPSDGEWEVAYWQHMATTRPSRLWFQQGWDWRPWLGDDERRRRTLVWGRWVLALWHCRCADCREGAARLARIVDSPMQSEAAEPDQP